MKEDSKPPRPISDAPVPERVSAGPLAEWGIDPSSPPDAAAWSGICRLLAALLNNPDLYVGRDESRIAPKPAFLPFMTPGAKPAGDTFNLRFLPPIGIYADEDGNTTITPASEAPYVVRFIKGVPFWGWPPATAGEIIASGIDPTVLTIDVINVIQGNTGTSGPGVTYPPAPE